MKKNQQQAVESMQNDSDYVVLSNPLASPKFVRMIGKGKELAINDTYTPKIFYEIASRLKPEHLQGIDRSQSIKFDIQLKDFLQDIGANAKNYKHLIQSIEIMQSNLLRWKEGDDIITTAIITKSVHNEKTGKVEIYIDSDIAKRILEVKQQNNFHFLKSNIFRLQNAQAIKLYPFFKSWLNHGRYETGLDRFKEDFGYDSSGYRFWNNFRDKVILQAIEDINEKTDIIVTYETTGENLEGLRPRVTGLIFWITAKDKAKKLPDGSRKTTEVEQAQETPAEPPQAPQEQPAEVEPISTPDNSELYDLFKKIQIKTKPDDVTSTVLVDSWVNSLTFEVVKDGFLGMLATKAQPETVAFFTPDNFKKYTGYSKKQQEQQEQKAKKQEALKQEQDKTVFIQKLTDSYNKDRATHYQKRYEELTQEQKAEHMETLWQSNPIKTVYCKNGDKSQPNGFAIEVIGELLTFPNGYDHNAMLKSYALKTYGVQIDFDADGKIVLV